MNSTEKVVKHLEITQAVIDRLGRNSLWIKSWSLILIVASDGFNRQTGYANPIFCFGTYSARPRVLDSRRILSLAGAVVSTSIQRNQSSIRYRFRDESHEA